MDSRLTSCPSGLTNCLVLRDEVLRLGVEDDSDPGCVDVPSGSGPASVEEVRMGRLVVRPPRVAAFPESVAMCSPSAASCSSPSGAVVWLASSSSVFSGSSSVGVLSGGAVVGLFVSCSLSPCASSVSSERLSREGRASSSPAGSWSWLPGDPVVFSVYPESLTAGSVLVCALSSVVPVGAAGSTGSRGVAIV